MNEFTKEELESILNWGDVYCEFGASWMYKAHKPLMDKLQSMIDNYCDHECNGEKEIFVDTCKKCNAYLLRESYYE